MFCRSPTSFVKYGREARCLLRNLTIHSKNYGFGRENHSVRREKNPHAENDSGLIDPTNSMWRSVTADHKEVEQTPTDQTENILNYYKERWIQEHKERKDVEVISGSEVSRNPDSGNKKSLYSQLARKTPLGNSGSGNVPLGFQHGETVVRSRDPFCFQKMPSAEPNVNKKENGGFDQIRGAESAPGLWSSEKSPYASATPSRTNSHLDQSGWDSKIHEGSSPNPFKPVFSKMDFDEGGFGSKKDRMESSRTLAQNNKNVRQESKKVNQETKDGIGTSLPFQTASPPTPDFKSS